MSFKILTHRIQENLEYNKMLPYGGNLLEIDLSSHASNTWNQIQCQTPQKLDH